MSYASDALIDTLERQVKKTKAENAKLRSQCADLVDERERLFQANVEKNGEVLRLVNENAKLRELIADVHESLKADKAGMFHNLTLSAMEDDMRELGIEVDYGQQRDV